MGLNRDDAGLGSFYRSKHELVFVFKCGDGPHINNFRLGETGRYRTNVWDYPAINTLRPARIEELSLHPTVKPVALVADAIRDCSKRNGIILDAFCRQRHHTDRRRTNRAQSLCSRARSQIRRHRRSALGGVHRRHGNTRRNRRQPGGASGSPCDSVPCIFEDLMTKHRSTRDYEIGYGRPPIHTRFKPGQSGNPAGRPKGAQNSATEIAAELRGGDPRQGGRRHQARQQTPRGDQAPSRTSATGRRPRL
jgi:hypothetical protein